MKLNTGLLVTLCGLLLLSACKPKQSPTEASFKQLKKDFTTRDIGNLLYGANYSEEKEEWKWINRDSSLYSGDMSLTDTVFIGQINLVDTFTINGVSQLAVVANEFPDVKCETCSPAICLYTFEMDGDTAWRLKQKRLIDFIGTLFTPPTGEVIELGKELYGLKFEPVYNDQGYTTGTLYLYLYGKDTISEVVKVSDAYQNNSGSFEAQQGKEFEYNTYIIVTDTTKPVFDIALVREGTYLDLNKGIDIDEISDTVSYTFDGKVYKPLRETLTVQ